MIETRCLKNFVIFCHTFNFISKDNRVNERDTYRSSIVPGNGNNSFPVVQYVSSTSEDAMDYFDSKNITGIDNWSDDASLNKSDDANNILQHPESFSQLQTFQNKSNWNPLKGHTALEMFLS